MKHLPGKTIPLDYTFCSGLRCKKANTCLRWVNRKDNEEMFKKHPHRPISIASFSDHNGDCDRGMYIPESPTKPNEEKENRDE